MITLETFMGGGRDLGQVQGNLRVLSGTPRVLVFEPTVAGLRVTFDTTPYGGPGGPKHIFINEGLHDVEVFSESGDSLGFCRRQSDTIVYAFPGSAPADPMVWSISDADGGSLNGPPVRMSSTLVRMSSTTLNFSYSW